MTYNIKMGAKNSTEITFKNLDKILGDDEDFIKKNKKEKKDKKDKKTKMIKMIKMIIKVYYLNP